MRERFLRRFCSAGLQPRPPEMNATGLQIHWIKSAGMMVKIQLCRGKLPTKSCDLQLKRKGPQELGDEFALEAEVRRTLVSRPRRRAS